jgi:hypothetical protein
MDMGQTILVKRGTRAQIEAAKVAGQLNEGEPYLITNENRLAVGIDSDGYSSFVKTDDNRNDALTGTLQVSNGGLGGTSFTGYLKGLGTDITTTNGIPAEDINGPLDCGTF